jgi:trimethylamine corrinoid protein
VYSLVRAGGYDLLEYGHGITAGEVVKRAQQDNVEILLLSTLMLCSALHVKEVRKLLDEADSHTKIVV